VVAVSLKKQLTVTEQDALARQAAARLWGKKDVTRLQVPPEVAGAQAEAFLDALARDVVGRAPTEEERARWAPVLTARRMAGHAIETFRPVVELELLGTRGDAPEPGPPPALRLVSDDE
jgi:hypothetical protein